MIPFILFFICVNTAEQVKVYSTQADGSTKLIGIVQNKETLPLTPPQQMPGWPKNMGVHPNYSPSGVSLVDITGDGYLDIIAGSTNSSVYAWDYQGNPLTGWPVALPAAVQAKVAIGDIDDNGDMEIIVAARNGNVYVLNHDGTNYPGWPQNANGILGLIAPTLFDLDQDGDLEIIMVQMQSGQPGHVYIWHHDGQTYAGWPQNMDYLGVATAAVADIDNDSLFEIIALSYNSVYAWDQNGNPEPGWPKLNVAGGMSYAQPVLADLDDDGDLEVLHSYYTGSQNYVGIYHHDASNFTGWPGTFPGPQTYTMPVTGDIDSDEDLEIFGGGHVMGGVNLGARHHTGTIVTGWPVVVQMLECSPIVFDLDDDGDREVLVGDNSTPGTFHAFHGDGSAVTDWPVNTTAAIMVNSAAVSDVDADGDIEIALVVRDGTVNLWTLDNIKYRGYLTDWSTYFHDIWNTGWLHPAPPQNLMASGLSNSVDLVWNANTETDIAGYNVYRCDSSGGPYDRINTTLVTDTVYSDTTVVLGNNYYYCVTAQIKAFAESRLSNEEEAYVGLAKAENKTIFSIALSPNPFTDQVFFTSSTLTNLKIKIYDIKGSCIDETTGIQHIDWIPEKCLPTGIYFAEIMTDKGTHLEKLIRIK